MTQPPTTGSLLTANSEWYRSSIFYEVHVRGFFDATGDGNGDLRGLTEKLDYLEWLGIDCLWLLPFYQSPLRDGGYDISDFLTVHPDFGTVEDAAALIEEAHRRGIRVIADMVMNHTSDQHPWFLESRQDRTNPKADWYVWGDDDQRWSEARVIFVDTEPSNWTFDQQRQQYYWHRFFHHQPDLNYDNPEVQDAMLDVVLHWLGLGLDGFRLDAVPYLFERDGTNGENLPETHAFLRRLRSRGRRRVPRQGAARRGQPVARGRRRVLRRRRRVPHVLPLPADAAHVHVAAARGAHARSSEILERDPRDPRRVPSGASSCATTTSSPSRWSPTKSATTCGPSTRRTRACGATSASAGGCSRCSRTTAARPSCCTRCC